MDEDQARDRIASAIVSGFLLLDQPPPLAQIEDLADDLLPLWKEQPSAAPAPGSLGALLPSRYVIPDHDLKVVETCISVLTSTAGANYFLPQLGGAAKGLAAPITGILVAVIKLAYNLRLAVRLEARDYAVVALLSRARADGMSSAALLEALGRSWPELTEQTLESSLNAVSSPVKQTVDS